jgi:hypothetical protein
LATTAIKKDASNVWIKTSPHINTEQAERTQKRGSEEDKKQLKLKLYCNG